MQWLVSGGAFWTVFVASFLGVAVWESWKPLRELSEPVERRWGRNWLLFVTSFAVCAVLVPASPVLLAVAVEGSRFGLLNQGWIGDAVRFILAVLILDFTKFAAHRALHSFHFLWRVHQVHHSDRDFDVSTSVRSHPLEVVLFQGSTLLVVSILAPPPAGVLVVQLLSVFESFFSHSNASLPVWLQKVLGVVLYTGDTHRIHHSADVKMQNSNFGDIFPWWDRLFGTYLPPAPNHAKSMRLGVEELQQGESLSYISLLKQPFVRK